MRPATPRARDRFRLPAVDRKDAEKIVGRDLKGVIAKMLKGLPFKPPDGLVEQIYKTSFEAMVTNLADGSIQVGPDGHLTAELVQSTGLFSLQLSDRSGNKTQLPYS